MLQHTRHIIKTHSVTHAEFEYYFSVIEKIEENYAMNPDISIESSKSLIEGVSKTILLRLETTQTESKVNAMDFPELFRNSCWSLQRHGSFEVDFVHRSASLIQRMAEIRNERGDISHGKSAPKTIVSTPESAKMIMQITDSIVDYMLDAFFKIDLSFKEELKYEDHEEFNLWLDDQNQLNGVSFSKALFDQDSVLYEEELENYLAFKEEE